MICERQGIGAYLEHRGRANPARPGDQNEIIALVLWIRVSAPYEYIKEPNNG